MFKKSGTMFVVMMLSVIVLLSGCSVGGSVENTENYSFDASNKTLTIHSNSYFDGDYEKFTGSDSSYVLENVVIDDGVTKIGESAFLSCENLKSITILDGVTKINSLTFAGCEN